MVKPKPKVRGLAGVRTTAAKKPTVAKPRTRAKAAVKKQRVKSVSLF